MVDRLEEGLGVVASDGLAQRVDGHFAMLPSSTA